MKRLMLLVGAFVSPICAVAASVLVDGVTWYYETFDKEGMTCARIVQKNKGKYSGDLVVPKSFGNYPVIEIGENAFSDCYGLTSVSLPSNILRIGDSAFSRCVELVSVNIPSRTKEIGKYAFFDCGKLMAITIPDGVAVLRTSTFEDCTTLTSITIPNSVTNLEDAVFGGCTALASVTIPNSVMVVGDAAFASCSALTSVTIPPSVADIGDRAFYYCSGLSSAVVCEGVSSIGEGAFFCCSELKSVTIPSSVTSIGSSAFNGCSGLTSVTISEGVTSIGSSAFNGCSGLKSVTIPSSVKSIGDTPFYGCDSLTQIYVAPGSSSYKTINDCLVSLDGAKLFAVPLGSCNVDIPAGVLEIPRGTVSGGYLQTLSIPSSVTNICDSAFSSSRLKTITISDGVGNIGESAFSKCRGLTSVTIPSSVVSIGKEAFMYCTGLMSVIISEGVINVGANAFYGCTNLVSVAMPTSVKHIGYYAFEKTGLLRDNASDIVVLGDCLIDQGGSWGAVNIPEGVRIIADGAFTYSQLSSVTFPSSMTIIGKSAFHGCTGLTSVVVPSSVTKIDEYAFAYCSGLKQVSILSSETIIGWNAFEKCSALTFVKIPKVSPLYWEFPDAYRWIKDVVICEGVQEIVQWQFSGCSKMKSVTIPASVESIGDAAFEDCVALETVYVGKGEINRIADMYNWSFLVEFVEVVPPVVDGDGGAVVTGDLITGFVVKPSVGMKDVEVTIPQGVDAAKVTVEVSAKVASVKPNGAKVKIAVGDNDITDYLVIPESGGLLNIAAATVKEEIVKETLNPSKDAVIELDAANPRLTTAPTRKGLTYTLFEGRELKSLSKGDTKLGDGDPWKPTITVSGGDAAFYSIDVSK